ncbi:MAG: hypothetical protein WCX65_12620 [bacterium]
MKTSFIIISITLLLAVSAVAFAETQAPYREALPPDLAAKYEHYVASYKARHIDRGGTVEAILDKETKTRVEKYYGHGDSQGWTGVTMAVFALQGDWDMVRVNLSYWPLCEIEPGSYKRYPDYDINEPYGQTSIDQYGEMIEGIAVVYLLGPEDLKQEMKRIIRNIIVYGNRHNWIFGPGPYANLEDIRFLFQLLADRMELDVNVYKDGENFDSLRSRFLDVIKMARLIHQAKRNYFTLNLHYERLLVAMLLKPDLKGLNRSINDWHKVVGNDDNTMFDWFHARATGADTSFVIDKLRAFPANLPNKWDANGYNDNNRWERSPEEIAKGPDGSTIEGSGMDFLALASFYSYFQLHDFGK